MFFCYRTGFVPFARDTEANTAVSGDGILKKMNRENPSGDCYLPSMVSLSLSHRL